MNKLTQFSQFATLTEEEVNFTNADKIKIIKEHLQEGISKRQVILDAINKACTDLDIKEIEKIIKDYYE